MLLPVVLALLQSGSPTLDGTIAPGEWDRATRATGSAGLEVFLAPTDSALFVAVRGPGDGFPHIALVNGDTVLLLHASAALGTARFVGAGNHKTREQEFVFRVRGVGLTGEDQAERDAFYAREGWVASTIRMGKAGETEFKISRSLIPASGPIAVAYWSAGSGVAQWPAGLEDAATLERTVQGFLPDHAEFRPAEWGTTSP